VAQYQCPPEASEVSEAYVLGILADADAVAF
jgi:hypothetical protein